MDLLINLKLANDFLTRQKRMLIDFTEKLKTANENEKCFLELMIKDTKRLIKKNEKIVAEINQILMN
jgi:hypothetical protein